VSLGKWLRIFVNSEIAPLPIINIFHQIPLDEDSKNFAVGEPPPQ